MRRLSTILFACLFMVITASQSHATLIVDTGTPDPVLYGVGGVNEFAGLVSIPDTLTISRIEGFFQQDAQEATVDLYIYSETAINPDYSVPYNTYPAGAGQLLGSFSVPAGNGSYNWFGLDTSLSLVSGEYWVSFGGNVYMGMYAPNPLAAYAVKYVANQSVGLQWYPYYAVADGIRQGWGVRVYGENGGAAPVAEPTTVLLLGLGLMGLAGVRRKIQK